ncbi:hypothetical protein LSAT2_030653, partial [Lamellibrachia satsuma]
MLDTKLFVRTNEGRVQLHVVSHTTGEPTREVFSSMLSLIPQENQQGKCSAPCCLSYHRRTNKGSVQLHVVSHTTGEPTREVFSSMLSLIP